MLKKHYWEQKFGWIAKNKKEETKGKRFDIVWQARWEIIKAWAKELTVRIEKKKKDIF